MTPDSLPSSRHVAAVLIAAAVLLAVAGAAAETGTRSTVWTQAGAFDPAFFKVANSEELWRGPTVDVPPGSDYLVTEDPVLPRTDEPWPDWRYRSNREGFRDDPVSREKPAGTTRILVLGSSMTMGPFVNETDRYTEVLERRLEETTGDRYRVINAGIPRAGIFDFYMFLAMLDDRYRPDMVITSMRWESDISRAEDRKRNDRMRQKTSSRITALRAQHRVGKAYLDDLTWRDSEVRMYGEQLLHLARDRDITPVLLTTHPSSHIGTFRTWAAEHDATFIGPPPAFARDMDRYTFADRHLTPDGHAVLAAHLHDRLTATGIADAAAVTGTTDAATGQDGKPAENGLDAFVGSVNGTRPVPADGTVGPWTVSRGLLVPAEEIGLLDRDTLVLRPVDRNGTRPATLTRQVSLPDRQEVRVRLRARNAVLFGDTAATYWDRYCADSTVSLAVGNEGGRVRTVRNVTYRAADLVVDASRFAGRSVNVTVTVRPGPSGCGVERTNMVAIRSLTVPDRPG